MRYFVSMPAIFCTAACVAPAVQAVEEAAIPPVPCEATMFPDDRFISPSFTDKYNGRYWSGSRQLDVWRREQRMFVGPPGGPWRQLQRTSDIGGEGSFRDGCGTAYQFILPPDGLGGYLVMREPNGRQSDWHRR